MKKKYVALKQVRKKKLVRVAGSNITKPKKKRK